MTTETRAVLTHFLAREGALVAEALRAEAAECQRFCDGTGSLVGEQEVWTNDRWQAAWRELCSCGLRAGQIGLDVFYEAYVTDDDCGFYVAPPHEKILTGDELANALRDIALNGELG